jgi:hypothetical protein
VPIFAMVVIVLVRVSVLTVMVSVIIGMWFMAWV